ncbi:MAG: hypothetical protein KJ583_02380 [Nanoarchaeota archaeon]|nr:hypothetical protein [Nanoarchaeota archaeon]MBU1269901.1 hypothetical protein [Nanoarchaeota archaeon]MBU1604142.1 hypothetical protein [Nanoarchaeota archaeon]MBU2443268.1 hypothetical protein [Nanoarchaeota archaeon]
MVTNKKCFGCGKKPIIKLSYTIIKYCNGCFVRLIEKRVRKDIRINKKIGRNKQIKLLNDGSKEFEVAEKILKNIFGEFANIKKVNKTDKETLTPTNLDREARINLESYLQNEKTPKKTGKLILNNVLEEEIIIFCKIKRIKADNKEPKNDLLESIEKKHPGTKFGIAKSFEKIMK